MIIVEEESPFLQIAGPLFLIGALALAGQVVPVFNLDLVLIALIGLVLSAKWKIRGCAYALVFLALSAAIKHLWIRDHHVFQATLEASVGFSLLIFALACEREMACFGALKQQIDNRSQTIRFLEDDLSKHKEASNAELVTHAEKLAELQQQLEEVQGDFAALQVLNEVLRTSSAQAIDERSTLSRQVLQAESHVGQLFEEIDGLQTELKRLANESALVQQNKELFEELNQARFKEAQTHLINETLVRMHAQQSQKAKELEGQCDRWAQEGSIAVARSEELQGMVSAMRAEMEALQGRVLAMDESVQGLRSVHQEERASLEEQLQRAKEESLEGLRTLSTRSNQTANIELLYRQLKGQFEEKNNVLHQVRAQLFLADTELQTLKMQAEQRVQDADPIPEMVRQEMEHVESENAALVEENGQLEELVTRLVGPVESKTPGGKRKLGTSPLVQQTSLF